MFPGISRISTHLDGYFQIPQISNSNSTLSTFVVRQNNWDNGIYYCYKNIVEKSEVFVFYEVYVLKY